MKIKKLGDESYQYKQPAQYRTIVLTYSGNKSFKKYLYFPKVVFGIVTYEGVFQDLGVNFYTLRNQEVAIPLPHISEDGSVCLGGYFSSHDLRGRPEEIMYNVVESFWLSAWDLDVWEDWSAYDCYPNDFDISPIDIINKWAEQGKRFRFTKLI